MCRAMISAVSLARAHLAVVMCFVNISLAMAFSKLSFEMKTHGQLRKSHAALQKQAAGISQEYTRMSSTIPAPKASADSDSPTSNAELAKAKVCTDVPGGMLASFHEASVSRSRHEPDWKVMLASSMLIVATRPPSCTFSMQGFLCTRHA